MFAAGTPLVCAPCTRLAGSHSRLGRLGAASGTSSGSQGQPTAPLATTASLDQKPAAATRLAEDRGPLPWLPATVGIVAAASAAVVSLSVADVSLAYIGGGPYGREVTRGQDLSGRDFSGLDLTGQDFKTSILRQAKFQGSKLIGASFFDSDLTGADFSGADLRGVDFSLASAPKANFTNALFEGATVTGNTSFKSAIIQGADFTDVLFRDDQKQYLCKVASGTNPVTGNDTRDTLFC